MNGRLLVGLCMTLLACGATTRSGRGGEGGGGAVSADGGSGGAAEGGGEAMVELSLDVVERAREGGRGWVALVGAHVRVDGADSSVEALSDEEGHVVAMVVPESGPWDVTVALAGYSPISILGVTESLTAPVHLSGRPPVDPNAEPEPQPERIEISGGITGRSWPGSVLNLRAPGVSGWARGSSYTGSVDPSESQLPGRFLATEWDSYDRDATPLNAVWVELPAAGELASAPIDVVLPSPAREVVQTTVELELPSSGAFVSVLGSEWLPSPYRDVSLVEDGYSHQVGRSRVEVGGHGVNARWLIDAFTGDMAPNQAGIELESMVGEDKSQHIIVNVDPSVEQRVNMPPAEVLETSGTTLDDLSVAWSAAEYSYAGASINSWDGTGSWYIYTFAGAESAMRRWPRLPEAVSREDVGLGSDDFKVNVFSVSLTGVPWDWEDNRDLRALVISTRLRVEPLYPEPIPTGPLNAYDGIYSLTDITMNNSACSEEGSSVRDQYPEDYFVVVGSVAGLNMVACDDLADCRAVAAAVWADEGVQDSSWRELSNFPGAPDRSQAFGPAANEEGLCTPWTIMTTKATGAPGEPMRVEVTLVDVPPHPSEAGECTSQLAEAAAEGVGCTKLSVYTGEFVEAL